MSEARPVVRGRMYEAALLLSGRWLRRDIVAAPAPASATAAQQ